MPTLSLGKHNPRLADIHRAVRAGGLTSDGLLPIEGPTLIGEAIRSGLDLLELYARPGVSPEIVPHTCVSYELSAAAFRKIQDAETSQGVIALARVPEFELSRIARGKRGPIMVLAGLQDPGNVGTILRTAEAFGASACLGLKGTVSVYNPKTVRASAGSVFRMPHVWNLELEDAVAALRFDGFRLVATAPMAPLAITAWNWTQPTAIVIGNEGRGLPPETTGQCEALLRVPHSDRVESLNSAIAAAVTLYEAYRQREGAGR